MNKHIDNIMEQAPEAVALGIRVIGWWTLGGILAGVGICVLLILYRRRRIGGAVSKAVCVLALLAVAVAAILFAAAIGVADGCDRAYQRGVIEDGAGEEYFVKLGHAGADLVYATLCLASDADADLQAAWKRWRAGMPAELAELSGAVDRIGDKALKKIGECAAKRDSELARQLAEQFLIAPGNYEDFKKIAKAFAAYNSDRFAGSPADYPELSNRIGGFVRLEVIPQAVREIRRSWTKTLAVSFIFVVLVAGLLIHFSSRPRPVDPEEKPEFF